MRNNRVKLEKARDIASADPLALYTDEDGRMDALNQYIAVGKLFKGGDDFIHGGAQITLTCHQDGGGIKTYTYSGREYNRALAADRAMKARSPIVHAPTSPEPTHQVVWWKPSTWA